MSMLGTGIASLRQMIEWTTEPPYLTKFSFGKYFGQKFEDVPRDYLQWVVNQPGFDPGTLAACRRVLNGR